LHSDIVYTGQLIYYIALYT